MSIGNLIYDVQANLHPEAYLDTLNVLKSFVSTCEKQKDVHWVCNSAPGQGKTTALKALTKDMALKRAASPILIVFNNKDTMNSYYEEISGFALEHHRPFLIQYMNEDNFDRVYEEVDQYQVLCITQQRLRDLKLGYGDFHKIMYEAKEGRRARERLIIIDEMPIFINCADFDISSKDNAVDWFDHLGEASGLDELDWQFARITINKLIAKELEIGAETTKRLSRHFEDEEQEIKFNDILNELSMLTAQREHVVKYRWFLKLLRHDNIGVIDKKRSGYRIICAEIVDYREMGNILILDGTSDLTPSFYSGFVKEKVKNYHNYKGRLNLHQRVISTSARSRTGNPEIVALISDDLYKLRGLHGDIFPLMAKKDIDKYTISKVIDGNLVGYFKQRTDVLGSNESSNDMPINILNTVGKNILNEFNSLALLNLPIRHPDAYKKSAIALLGTEVNIRINDGHHNSWFEDNRVQAIFEEIFMADIVQLIHRCSLRNINQDTPVHIFLYTKQKRWIDKLQFHFDLSDHNVTSMDLNGDKMEGFSQMCHEWASKSLEYLRPLHEKINNPLGVEVYPSKIGGTKFKEWFKNHWVEAKKRNLIIDIFAEYELVITEYGSKKYKKISYND